MATDAPSCARRKAMPRPMPLFAPVTSACRPSSLRQITLCVSPILVPFSSNEILDLLRKSRPSAALPPDVRRRLCPARESASSLASGLRPDLGRSPKYMVQALTEGQRPSAHLAAKPQAVTFARGLFFLPDKFKAQSPCAE